jgi:serine/threonine protein kinase
MVAENNVAFKRPSLLERRRLLGSGSGLNRLVCNAAKNDGEQTLPSASPSPSPSPSSSPEASPTVPGADASPFRRRRGRKLTPSINCDLIRQEQEFLADPFATSDCNHLSKLYDGFEKLGEGSCGVVYRARSIASKQEVALKVMRMHDEERLLCAKKEYELLVHIRHPNIIKALDFFSYSMGAVLVLELFNGENLEQVVQGTRKRSLTETVARQLFIQLLQAVAHLHAHGFIHRDIKPENVLVSQDLTALRLVDFNAAKNLHEGGALTMTGTVDYMPPEVMQGNSPSAASDIWASGLCLHMMLLGRLPSRRRSLQIYMDSQSRTPVKLEGSKWEAISQGCKEVVLMCLEIHQELRPQACKILTSPWLVQQDSPAPSPPHARTQADADF